MKRWRRATQADLAALEVFLRGREVEAAGFIGRILREGRLRLPAAPQGGIWIREDGDARVVAALLGLPGGVWFPQLPSGAGDAEGLAAAFDARPTPLFSGPIRPTTVIGPAGSVRTFEACLRLVPDLSVPYRLMSRGPFAARAETRNNYEDMVVERCGLEALEALYPLQKAYEEEEVLTPLHVFDAEGCRAFLARSLREQLVFAMGREPGVFVGKAGTNARAFTLDQIGGVYVLPELRGRGLGRALMETLLAFMGRDGRASSLFVKKTNAAALGLYRGLGYDTGDDFLADYLKP
jgi:ribosomal protein S18 acetylase RimI-like enzyme